MKKILFPARGLNRDRCFPLCTTFSGWALGTELRWLNGLRPFKCSCLSATERRTTAAKRDDLHSKSLFLVKNKGQWNAKKRSKGSVWEFCYANKIFGTFGFEMRACGQKFVKFCTLTHTHTTAAKLVVRIEEGLSPILYNKSITTKKSQLLTLATIPNFSAFAIPICPIKKYIITMLVWLSRETNFWIGQNHIFIETIINNNNLTLSFKD